MKKIKETATTYWGIVMSLIIAMVVYFQKNICFTPDSLWYIGYLDYFLGEKDIFRWRAGRGPGMPLIVYISYLVHPGYKGLNYIFAGLYLLFMISTYGIVITIDKSILKGKRGIIFIILINILLRL